MKKKILTGLCGALAITLLGLHNGFFSGALGEKASASSLPTAVRDIADPSVYSQVVMISDVHGMYAPLRTLLQAGKIIDAQDNWAAGRSLLVVVGDSIDKGPQSLEVLDLWIRLQTQAQAAGGDLIHLLGNHEAEFLSDPQDDSKAADLISEMRERGVPLSDLTGTSTPRGQFLHSQPLAIRVGAWLFCHAGLFPEMSWQDFATQAQSSLSAQHYGDDLLIGDDSILEAKKWELKSSTVKDLLQRLDGMNIYGTVFGHQPHAFGIEGRTAAKYSGRLIKIDNGMAPEAGSNPGSLLVFSQPSGMTQKSFEAVQAKVILPDGSQQDLQPE